MSGEYTWHTGKDLRDLPLHLMYEVAYVAMRKMSITDDGISKQYAKADRLIRSSEETYVTGLPEYVRGARADSDEDDGADPFALPPGGEMMPPPPPPRQ